MNKLIKYSILILVLGMAFYNSVNIEPLDQINKDKNNLIFDAKAYANNFMYEKVQTLPAINASNFLDNIAKNVDDYCEQKGRKLGISDEYNFIIEGKAKVNFIEDEYVVVTLNDGHELRIATDFIFGNAIRDGSAMANIGDYQNTMDFNSISVELNNIVRENVVPTFKEKAKIGEEFYFKGAVKIDITKPQIKGLKVIPLSIKFSD